VYNEFGNPRPISLDRTVQIDGKTRFVIVIAAETKIDSQSPIGAYLSLNYRF
jgi:hypothetical protein